MATFSSTLIWRQQAHVLEGAAHAHAGDLARGVAGHRLAEEAHLARGRRIHARDLVEHRALAGAVGADQREDLAGLHLRLMLLLATRPPKRLVTSLLRGAGRRVRRVRRGSGISASGISWRCAAPAAGA
jgi:hypothetical protein